MNYNKTIVIGNITRDLDIRALPSGGQVVSFSVATNRGYTDRDGKKQEQTEFHSVVVFGKQADSCAQFLKKGSEVLVEGHLQTRSWDNKEGQKQYRTEIVAERVQFGRRPEGKENLNPEDVPW